MKAQSRIQGFYRLDLEERCREIAERAGVSEQELRQVTDTGGLSPKGADKIVENVLGVYGLPFGVGLNFLINGADRFAPMVVEEPSVIAAASNAARMVREAGGFHAEVVEALMTAQVQVFGVTDGEAAIQRLSAAHTELLELARAAVPNLVRRGGGPRSVEARNLGHGMVALHVQVDCKDAMGANLVNTVAEALGPRVASLTSGSLGLRILTNLCDRRRVRVKCRVNPEALLKRGGSSCAASPANQVSGRDVADAIEQASRFAEADPYRAATHNKGLMNGLDSVVMATGNDYRAVEAGAHAYAARQGVYRPLSVWRSSDEGLQGELELPLALGTVGGTLRVHPCARLSLKIAGVKGADDLAMLAASVGLASNLAALRALATEGIQRGHMSLHARSVACAAGAEGAEVEAVAGRMAQNGTVNLSTAQEVLGVLRARTSAEGPAPSTG